MTAETAVPFVQGVQSGVQIFHRANSLSQEHQPQSNKPYVICNSAASLLASASSSSLESSSSLSVSSSEITSSINNVEYAQMEAWLDEHPDFVSDYFLRYSIFYLLEYLFSSYPQSKPRLEWTTIIKDVYHLLCPPGLL